MKKVTNSPVSLFLFLFSGMLLWNFSLTGQELPKTYPILPDNIKAIVTNSCMPCHSSTGRVLSKEALNFTDWTLYSETKQKEKAEVIYSVIKKDKMPPKSARETRPEIILTREQLEIIREWSESFDLKTK